MIKTIIAIALTATLSANTFTDIKESLEHKVACLKCKQCQMRAIKHKVKHRFAINSNDFLRASEHKAYNALVEKFCVCNSEVGK